jgi:hypothetical protein
VGFDGLGISNLLICLVASSLLWLQHNAVDPVRRTYSLSIPKPVVVLDCEVQFGQIHE